MSATVVLSGFLGTTDSDKLDAFAHAYAPANVKPTLVLDDARDYTFSRPLPLFDGFAMVGGGMRAVDQARAQHVLPQTVKLRCATGTGWLVPGGSTCFGVFLGGLSFDAVPGDANRVFAPTSTVIWTSVFRDISYQNGAGFMGSSSQAQPIDLTTFDGWWNLNNITDVAWNLAGSDGSVCPTRMAIDSPTALMGPTGTLVRTSSLSKTPVTNLYITAEQHRGLVASGANDHLTFRDCEVEGRNAGKPSYGALAYVNNSEVLFDGVAFRYGMSNPNGAAGGAAQNKGLVHIASGANVRMDWPTFRQSTAGTCVYVEKGASLRIIGASCVDPNGNQVKATVRAEKGANVKVDVDTVSLVTV